MHTCPRFDGTYQRIAYFLLEQMQKTNFGNIIKERLNQGALYIGCSAGSVVACPNIDFIEKMDNPSESDLKDCSGLGLIDFYVMPHTDHSEYGSQARSILKDMEENNYNVVGLKDDQALFVNGDEKKIL